ncbi:Xenotropic and polytropic retrovirus receptor 1 like protein [Nosema granulosis]|uniref:Xenotropic and polytropic retrovirus receptor 1 like protein n=1 Tax=Nosema granulosis TaxID=83296 RepID=A0A9P6L0M8_9MICR|nr:Xenotropic and polytropic retrovirus receptor 1 like protein [Nosema granulosis]
MIHNLEDFYIQYDLIKSCLKQDRNKFKQLLDSNFIKIAEFYYDIKIQTESQMKKLFEYLSENIDDKKILEITSRSKRKDTATESSEDENCSDYLYSSESGPIKDSGVESHASQTGIESDVETLDGSLISDIPEENMNLVEGCNKYGYLDKKRGFIFSSFNITGLFERRKREKAFHELMQAITFVIRYKDINYLGMTILISKYKRMYPNDPYASEFLKKVHSSPFYKSKRAARIQKDIRKVYRRIFAKDDKNRAKFVFKHIGRKTKVDPWTTFILGILLTITCVLIYTTDYNEEAFCVKKVVYSLGLCHLGGLLFGGCILLFEKYDINYKLIFNFDVVSSMTSVKYELTVSCFIFFEFLAAFLFANAYPKTTMYTVLFTNLFIIFCPFDIVFYRSRLYLISVIPGMIGSIFKSVFFKHFFFADVCQSFSKCFNIIIFEIFEYGNYPDLLLSVFFALIRLVQCLKRYKDTKKWLPHLINMCKYLVVAFSIFASSSVLPKNYFSSVCIFFITFLASSFCLFWDFVFDWSLYRRRKVFPAYFYYFAVLYNTIARYLWILKFYITIDSYVLIIIEIFRRFIWTLFRVENEHINNCRGGRSKIDILFSNELFYKKDTDTKQIVKEEGEEILV